MTQVVVDPAQSSGWCGREKIWRPSCEINSEITVGRAGSEASGGPPAGRTWLPDGAGRPPRGASTDHEMFRAFDLPAGFLLFGPTRRLFLHSTHGLAAFDIFSRQLLISSEKFSSFNSSINFTASTIMRTELMPAVHGWGCFQMKGRYGRPPPQII